MKKRIIHLFLLLFVAAMTLSACAMLRGDPRKNCNHPDHGEYMMQKRQKAFSKG